MTIHHTDGSAPRPSKSPASAGLASCPGALFAAGEDEEDDPRIGDLRPFTNIWPVN